MRTQISKRHPLRRLFDAVTQKCFVQRVGVADFEIVGYAADLLVGFLHSDDVYRLRNARGKRIYEVAEMLLEANKAARFPGKRWEREIRKYIGDYTLFMAGLFPESLSRHTILDLDYFIDYVKAGKESYRIVAEFDEDSDRAMVPLFRKLSQNFEICAVGLNFVREELERVHNPAYRQIRDIIHE